MSLPQAQLVNYALLGIMNIYSDIKARGKENQLHHYRFGDVVELFLNQELKYGIGRYTQPCKTRTALSGYPDKKEI